MKKPRFEIGEVVYIVNHTLAGLRYLERFRLARIVEIDSYGQMWFSFHLDTSTGTHGVLKPEGIRKLSKLEKALK